MTKETESQGHDVSLCWVLFWQFITIPNGLFSLKFLKIWRKPSVIYHAEACKGNGQCHGILMTNILANLGQVSCVQYVNTCLTGSCLFPCGKDLSTWGIVVRSTMYRNALYIMMCSWIDPLCMYFPDLAVPMSCWDLLSGPLWVTCCSDCKCFSPWQFSLSANSALFIMPCPLLSLFIF